MKYYSELLDKKFDTVKELEVAEKDYNDEKLEKIKVVKEKKDRAIEIEKAYKTFVETEKKARKERAEAIEKANQEYRDKVKEVEDNYYKLRNDFIKDYGSYHLSYFNNNGKEEITISDIVNSFFDLLN